MSISAQMSDAARRVHEKLQAFVASGEYNVSQGRVVTSDAITGGKATAYDFSQVFSVEGTNDATMRTTQAAASSKMKMPARIKSDE